MKQISLIFILTLPFFFLSNAQINQNFDIMSYPSVYDADSDWGDYNNDGRIDVMITGDLQSGDPVAVIYRNEGSWNFVQETKALFPGVSKGAVKWGDYNNDGFLDLFLCGRNAGGSNISGIYKNNGDSTFTELEQLSLVSIAYAEAGWSDIDRDGDLDLFLAGYQNGMGAVYKIYENLGEDQFEEIIDHNLPGMYYGEMDFADLNKDGFPDICLAGKSSSGGFADVFLNTGKNSFSPLSAGLEQVDFGSVAFGDYDLDGDYDLVLGGQSDTVGLWLYENIENVFEIREFADYGLARGDISWGEYDNDGYPDVLVAGMDKSYNYQANVFRNNQDGTFTRKTDFINGIINGSEDWVDYDNDGDMDVFVSGDSKARLFVNNSSIVNADPAVPTNLVTETRDSIIIFQWLSASDNKTNSKALSYNVIFGMETDSGKILCPHADFNTGFLKTVDHGNAGCDTFKIIRKPLSGNYIWSVQTVDNGFRGSAFADFQDLQIAVNPPAVQTQQLRVSDNSPDSLIIRFEKGDGEQTIVFMAEGSVDVVLPQNETTYIAESIFGNGSKIGTSGFYCVYRGDEDSIVVSGLKADQEYTLFALEFNGDGGMETYLSGISPENRILTTTDFFNVFSSNISYPTYLGKNMWADLDNDNDLDFLTYGLTEGYEANGFRIFINDQNSFSCRESASRYITQGDCELADFNNDNTVDLIFSEGDGEEWVQIYLNDGDANFSLYPVVSIPALYEGDILILDFDRDGNMDVVLSGFNLEGTRSTLLYRNKGNMNFEKVEDVLFSSVENPVLSSCDVNSDGYTDILLSGVKEGGIALTELYLNLEGVNFELQEESGLDNFISGTSDWMDTDQDGDPDLLMTGYTSYDPETRKSAVYLNDGNGHFSEQILLPGAGISNGDACWADLNQDSRPDIITAGEVDYNQREAAVFMQNEDHSFSRMDHIGVFPVSLSSIAIADFDNDGDNDVYLSGMKDSYTMEGGILENLTDVENLPPSVPDGLVHDQAEEKILLSWNNSTDDYTSSEALSYNLYVKLTESDNFVISSFTGDNGYQRIYQNHNVGFGMNNFLLDSIAPGNYSWAVQAVDAGGRFSEFSGVSDFYKKYTQEIVFDTLNPVDYGAEKFLPVAISSLALPISLDSSDPEIAEIGTEGEIIPGLAGQCTITASQAGNDTVLMADPVKHIMLVNPVLPEVETTEFLLLESGNIEVSAELISHGGETSALRGVCYGSEENPDTDGDFIQSGTGEGEFQAVINSSEYENIVYFRSFASNTKGTVYGQEFSVNKTDVDPEELEEIRIFPNPGDGFVHVHFEKQMSGVKIKVLNSGLKIVYMKENISGREAEINISHLSPGMYVFIIEKSGEVIMKEKYLLF